MSVLTTLMGLGKAVDGDNAKTYLETVLGGALDAIDAHTHENGKGAPVKRLQFGLASARPAFGNAGHVYFATDTGAYSLDSGAAWSDLFGPATSAAIHNSALATDVARLNLLVNGGFENWQRGSSLTVAQDGFFADRWQVHINGGGTMTSEAKDTTNQDAGSGACAALVVAGSVALGVAGGAAFPANGSWIKQKYEDFAQFKGKTVTFSIRVKGPAATTVMPYVHDGVALYNGQSFNTGTGYTTVTMTQTLAAGAAQLEVGLMFGATGTFYVDNATLVPGSVAMDYLPLTPADDLNRCLRYYQRYTGSASYATYLGISSSATNAFISVSLVAPMGGTPTFSVSAASQWGCVFSNYGGSSACSALSMTVWQSPNEAVLQATVASGLTVGGVTGLGAFPNAAAWFAFEWNP